MATCVREVHLDDIGTIFSFPITDCDGVVDLTDLISATIRFEKKDKTVVEKDGSVQGDPTLGILEYITLADDLDQVGGWRAQGMVVLPTGTWHSDIQKFKVMKNLEVTA